MQTRCRWLVLIAMVSALFAGLSANAGRPVIERMLLITSRHAWQDTGIELREGDLIMVVASGTVRFDSAGRTSTPDGFPEPALLTKNGDCIYLVCGGTVSTHSLVGRVGSGSLDDYRHGETIGSRFYGRITRNGRLFLGFNDGFVRPDRLALDAGGVGDNDGTFQVRVTVTRLSQPSTRQGGGAGIQAAHPCKPHLQGQET